MSDLSNVSQEELLRRKEIVEWQITIAKCPKVLQEKQQQLKAINNQLEKF